MQARFAEDAPGTAGLRSEGTTEAVPAMANPVILVVDDDPQVLRAVERELRGRFGSDYRVVAAGSGADALDAIRRLILRGTPIALLVVDQRMPGMTGVELLGSTLPLLPGTKRVLLTAYADTDVAIRAINEIGLDHYLLKPWDPPEERLLPALAELLDDWRAGWIPPFDGVRARPHLLRGDAARPGPSRVLIRSAVAARAYLARPAAMTAAKASTMALPVTPTERRRRGPRRRWSAAPAAAISVCHESEAPNAATTKASFSIGAVPVPPRPTMSAAK